MNHSALTRRIHIKIPGLTRPAVIIAIAAAVIAGGGSAAALAATASQPAPSGSGFITVNRTVRFPAHTAHTRLQEGKEIVLSCPPNERAISGSDVPAGLNYDKTAAASGEYLTEWSGNVTFQQWDWYFLNDSSKGITMSFSVHCQQ